MTKEEKYIGFVQIIILVLSAILFGFKINKNYIEHYHLTYKNTIIILAVVTFVIYHRFIHSLLDKFDIKIKPLKLFVTLMTFVLTNYIFQIADVPNFF